MFLIVRWHTLERLLCLIPQDLSVCLFRLTSEGLEQMKHVLGGRLKRLLACHIRSAPSRDRVRGLRETSEKCAFFLYFGRYTPEQFLGFGIC